MTYMTIFLSIVLPIALIGLTFALKPIREWLEYCVGQTHAQSELTEEFGKSAMKFFKETDPEKDTEIREMVVWAGDSMLDGTKLVRGLMFSARILEDTPNGGDAHAKEVMDGLTEEARHAFASAMASALIVSSCQSLFFGKKYRSILKFILSEHEREVREPAQIVYRFQKSKALPFPGKTQTS